MDIVSHKKFLLYLMIPLINDLRALLDPATIINAALGESKEAEASSINSKWLGILRGSIQCWFRATVERRGLKERNQWFCKRHYFNSFCKLSFIYPALLSQHLWLQLGYKPYGQQLCQSMSLVVVRGGRGCQETSVGYLVGNRRDLDL